MKTVALRLLALLGSFVVVFCVFFLFVRPWFLRWGATDEEVHRALPGDEIIQNAGEQETRAITIHASIDRVWPWVAQLGQDRGGFYSFDLLENLVGCNMPTTDRLQPDKQAWQPGDKLWMYPKDKAGGVGFATLRAFIPGRACGFGTHMVGTPLEAPENGSWSFFLERVDDSTTRFIARGRGAANRALPWRIFDKAIFEPMHFVMERRMMTGLKQLAQGEDRGRIENHVQVVLWTITFGLFSVSIGMVLRRNRWERPVAGFVAAAVVFQILTFAQPPILIGLTLIAAVIVLLLMPRTVKC